MAFKSTIVDRMYQVASTVSAKTPEPRQVEHEEDHELRIRTHERPEDPRYLKEEEWEDSWVRRNQFEHDCRASRRKDDELSPSATAVPPVPHCWPIECSTMSHGITDPGEIWTYARDKEISVHGS